MNSLLKKEFLIEAMKNKLPAIIFDLDGTLWNSSKEVTESWNEELKNLGVSITFSEEDFASVMGLPMNELGDILFSSIPDKEERERLLNHCMEFEVSYLCSHPGKMFPREREILTLLEKDYSLYILSNCQKGYIEAYLEGCNVSSLFRGHISWGDRKKNKNENISYLIKEHGLGPVLYVGDTLKDQIETNIAGIPFIFASYGFGEAKEPQYVAKTFSDLLELTKKILN